MSESLKNDVLKPTMNNNKVEERCVLGDAIMCRVMLGSDSYAVYFDEKDIQYLLDRVKELADYVKNTYKDDKFVSDYYSDTVNHIMRGAYKF